MKKAWIYKIENTKNKNCYVGSTTNLSRRKKDHLRILKENKHHCKYLQRAWNKYGEDLFTFEVVESFNYLTKEDILTKEQYYIDNLQSKYNCCKIAGSQLGSKRDKAFKDNCSKRMMGHTPWNKGKKGLYSEEYKEKIGSYHKGKVISKENRDKISKANSKKIKLISIEDEIIVFDSITLAAKELNTTFHLIWYNLKGRTKQTKFGKFEYYE